jgi:alpha-1,2-mannosyltransferase
MRPDDNQEPSGPDRNLIRWAPAGLMLVLAAAVAAIEWFLVTQRTANPLGDLDIYRTAIQFSSEGGDIYEFTWAHPMRPEGFPFTYPPFAALVLRPLIWLPTAIVDHAWTIGTLVLVAAMSALLVARLGGTTSTWVGLSPSRSRVVALTSAAAIVMFLSLPVIHSVVLGQISLAITALAFFDASGAIPRRIQGLLVGIASAIKLTPLVFVPYFAVTRQWRQVAVSVSTFFAALAVAAALMPRESLTYWGSKLFETSRVGELWAAQNKSILGFLARWGPDGNAQRLLWVAFCLVVLGVALWRAREQFRAGQLAPAAIIVGCASVSVSPISWPHHQSWAILAGLWLAFQRRPMFMLMGLLLLVSFMVWSPLMGLEVINQDASASTLLRVAREIPTLSFLAICILGLPLKERLAEAATLRTPVPTNS